VGDETGRPPAAQVSQEAWAVERVEAGTGKHGRVADVVKVGSGDEHVALCRR